MLFAPNANFSFQAALEMQSDTVSFELCNYPITRNTIETKVSSDGETILFLTLPIFLQNESNVFMKCF